MGRPIETQNEPGRLCAGTDREPSVIRNDDLVPVARRPLTAGPPGEQGRGRPPAPGELSERGFAVARSVAQLTTAAQKPATGFLVSDDLLMTNRHVFPSPRAAAGATARFNYLAHPDPLPAGAGERYSSSPEDGFHADKSLDYAIVRFAGAPGRFWGHLSLAAGATVAKGSDAVIVQYPWGMYQMIGAADNEIVDVDEKFLRFEADTSKGSSGSPIFTARWQLIGLHSRGVTLVTPDREGNRFANRGIRISAIAEALPDWAKREIRIR